MKYDCLLFDADDTLFDYNKAEAAALKLAFQYFDLLFDEHLHLKKYREINKIIWKELEDNLITQQKLKAERFRRFFDYFSINNISPENFSSKYLQLLSEGYFLLPFVISTLEEIYKKFKTAVITNGLKEVQRPRIKHSGISQFIDKIVISDEIKIAKPDRRIFEYTLNKLKHTNKSTVLMIGDNLSSDIKGGNDFGIDTCWININGISSGSNIIPSYVIRNISEIKSIIYA